MVDDGEQQQQQHSPHDIVEDDDDDNDNADNESAGSNQAFTTTPRTNASHQPNVMTAAQRKRHRWKHYAQAYHLFRAEARVTALLNDDIDYWNTGWEARGFALDARQEQLEAERQALEDELQLLLASSGGGDASSNVAHSNFSSSARRRRLRARIRDLEAELEGVFEDLTALARAEDEYNERVADVPERFEEDVRKQGVWERFFRGEIGEQELMDGISGQEGGAGEEDVAMGSAGEEDDGEEEEEEEEVDESTC